MSLFVHKTLCTVENVEFAPGLMTLEILRQDRNFKFTQPLLLSTHNVDDDDDQRVTTTQMKSVMAFVLENSHSPFVIRNPWNVCSLISKLNTRNNIGYARWPFAVYLDRLFEIRRMTMIYNILVLEFSISVGAKRTSRKPKEVLTS